MPEKKTRAEHERDFFRKLNISVVDLSFARHHAHQILTKKLYRSQTKGVGQARYAIQVAFVTALVAAYGRAFAQTKGSPEIPKKLRGYSAEENALHEELLELRNQLCAHSDADKFYTFAVRTATIQMIPFYCIKREKIKLLLSMTKRVQAAFAQRAVDMHPYR